MSINPELLKHYELKPEEVFREAEYATIWYVIALILDAAILLAIVAHAVLMPMKGVPHEVARDSAWFAIELILIVLGPITIIIVGLGFAVADFSRIWTKLFGQEIETFVAIKRTAWVIGYLLTALNVAYIWDFTNQTFLYGIVIALIGVGYYEAGEYPKTVVKEKEKAKP
jgi:hypothetical protein